MARVEDKKILRHSVNIYGLQTECVAIVSQDEVELRLKGAKTGIKSTWLGVARIMGTPLGFVGDGYEYLRWQTADIFNRQAKQHEKKLKRLKQKRAWKKKLKRQQRRKA